MWIFARRKGHREVVADEGEVRVEVDVEDGLGLRSSSEKDARFVTMDEVEAARRSSLPRPGCQSEGLASFLLLIFLTLSLALYASHTPHPAAFADGDFKLSKAS